MDTSAASRIQSSVINTASFLAQFAISMVNLALVYHLRIQFDLSPQMVGISAAIYTTTYFICCLLFGPLASHMKPRHSVELSMIGMAIAIGVVVRTNYVSIAFGALVLYGMAMSFLWPQIEGWLARGKEGRLLNRATSSFNVSWSLGAALSPLLTGILLETSTDAPLIASAIVMLIIFAQIATVTHLVPEIRAVASERTAILHTTIEDASTPLRFLSWAGVLTVYASFAVILTIFPMHAMDNLPYTETYVGLLLLMRGLATVSMFILMGKTSSWHFNRPLVIVTQVLVALLCLWGASITSFHAYAWFFILFGILFAISYSFSIFHGASGSIHRSKRMLIHEILLTIGTIFGSIFGGTVYQYSNFRNVLLVCAATVMIPAVAAVGNGLFRKGIH